MKQHVNDKYLQEIAELNHNLDLLEKISLIINHEEITKIVDQLHKQSEYPFLFVVVGEVKAGKSSFINALLQSDKEICKVAASPMTDTIQLITYSDSYYTEQINPLFKKIGVDAEILNTIAIVDTPGTNSIIQEHQQITENFIPFADLVCFVFEAKNPYRQSSWEFFDYIRKEWHRKVLFILQQKDLLNNEDLQVNINGVKDFAISKGITAPVVFPVSALMELNHQADSGFSELRNWIAENVTNGKAPILKLQNMIETAIQVGDKLKSSLILRQQQYAADVEFRNDIQNSLDYQSSQTEKQISYLVDNVLETYDSIMYSRINEISDGLSITSVIKRSVGSIFGKENSLKSWLENHTKQLEMELNIRLKEKLNEGIIQVSDNIQLMGKLVEQKIRNSKTILKDNDEIFQDIAEKRANVLKDLQYSFSEFLKDSENFYDENIIKESNKLGPNFLTGSGIALVGVILTSVVNGAVFDITGGILTGIGLLFASITLGLRKNKIMKSVKDEISSGRSKIELELSTTLSRYTQDIKRKINHNFDDFDRLIQNEGKTLEILNIDFEKFDSNISDQRSRVNKYLN
ncbi:MAG TPA: dynamin family protein [Saprospiraceae bacterium]|nr:dynamin family protein [Saprospiraceae bacterium]HRX28595.1 dynamin family protein [Saprospiraceae bacterium]